MTTISAKERRDSITRQLIHLIDKKLPKVQADLLREFIPIYYSAAPIDDLEARDTLDLYGALISHWNLLYDRPFGQTRVKIYNPSYEEHGWQSTHTIIEVVHDDMPFLVDSLRMEINRLGFTIHLSLHVGGMKVKRDASHHVVQILPHDAEGGDGFHKEAPIYFEVGRQTDPAALEHLKECLEKVLRDVDSVVADWAQMRSSVVDVVAELEKQELKLDPLEVSESLNFLRWLIDDHFTFLGVRDYELCKENGDYVLRRVPHSGLGVLRADGGHDISKAFSTLPPAARTLALAPQILIISNTNTIATVHRSAYTIYIGIKRFNEKQEIIGERRVVGLFTSTAYHSNPRYTPLLRHKIEMVTKNLGFAPASHSAKNLLNILETLPRDDLFQMSVPELTEMCEGILQLQERKVIRLFVRDDPYGRFISCLVYVPREIFNTQMRLRFEKVLMAAFGGKEITFSTYFSESVLARIHFFIRLDPEGKRPYSLKQVEADLASVGRTWQDQLAERLTEHYGEEKGVAFTTLYSDAFPMSYIQDFDARTAVFDIGHIEELKAQKSAPISMSFYRPLSDVNGEVSFKIFHPDQTLPLSDVVPMLEHLGLRIIDERPYQLVTTDKREIWINDFRMVASHDYLFDIEDVKDLFHEIFAKVWRGEAEDDGFNQLVLSTRLNWRAITILRAYAKYFKQIGFTFSQKYIEETLAGHPDIVMLLIDLFKLRFDPALAEKDCGASIEIEKKILTALDAVQVLDEDRILRRYLEVIKATVRTNYYQKDQEGNFKPCLSFKFDPKLISDLPLPKPVYEIFVYSPRVEGVHLRGARVARGGIRWSDRREDFRTEILGLMKAQQVKNAVIVPLGAKGGFVPKQLPSMDDREAFLACGQACYREFMRGLLDLTDNIKEGTVVPPSSTVRYDSDDPYLVVAADKGTATFSDLANAVSAEYDFWLQDAFASGGSSGYDHKKMGITARGAWESVKHHFRSLGVNTQTTDFTVVGIGDMAGDVFGNGMLQSKHIRLVAAFNHAHIFLDPNPDAAKSFKERERLFNLPRSSWEDYDAKLLSAGGGIYRRSLKSIQLSPEVKVLLQVEQDVLAPNDLIRAILKAPVDLLWNGGIGTYVKSQKESHTDVGDKTNDGVRVNGRELRCKVVGEGGNLGCTQLGRVEYALNNGKIYTDFIDNSAGVNCSDFEVNIKILLNAIVDSGDMTRKQRDELLKQMTDEVAHLVLRNNYAQTHAISLASSSSLEDTELLARYIVELERQGKLNRELEFLPTIDELHERKGKNSGLTQPEIAILLSYTKIIIKNEILESNLPEESYFNDLLLQAFPKVLQEMFPTQIQQHSLRREIIATQLSNMIVNEMGITFVYRLQYETGMPVSSVVRAYVVTRHVYELPQRFIEIESVDNKVATELQQQMIREIVRLIRRCSRWFLRTYRKEIDMNEMMAIYASDTQTLTQRVPELLVGENKAFVENAIEQYKQSGVPPKLATWIGCIRALYPSLDIVEGARKNSIMIGNFAEIYYALGDFLHLGWLRYQISNHPVETIWDSLARAALRDDIDRQQREITLSLIAHTPENKSVPDRIKLWAEAVHTLLQRWEVMLSELRTAGTVNFTIFTVAVREVHDLAHVVFDTTN